MGEVEKRVTIRAKKQSIQRAVLSAVGTVGLLAVAVMAPNVLRLLRYTSFGKKKGLYRIDTAMRRLVERGELEWVAKNGAKFARLTKKGQIRLARLALYAGIPKKHWDGRWRIVIFDVPEKRRRSRDLLRETLAGIGFCRLQNSVWVYPYDCEDLVTLLKTDFAVGKNVLYIVSEHMEGDRQLRKLFNIPPH